MKTIALLLLLASQSGLRSTTLCTSDNPLDCLPPPAICGDGIIHQTEACDDGNRVDNDGCSMDCKRSSVVAARYRFDRTGTLDLPAGMPQPSFRCRGREWSGSGNLVCDGTSPLTFTPSGGPTAGVPTYWRPGGGSTAGNGIGFDGSDDYFETADIAVADAPTKMLILVKTVGTSATGSVIAKDPGGSGLTGRGWNLRTFGTALSLYVYSGESTPSSFGPALSTTQGTQTIGAFYYKYVADGTSVGLANVNGVTAAVSNLVGPIQSVSTPVRIGAARANTLQYAGTTDEVVFWDLSSSSYEPSAADLAYIVNSMTGKRGTNNEALTVTRANAQSVVLKNSDAEPFVTNVPSNQLAIGQNGAEIYGARTSRIPWNQRSSANNAVGGISGTSSTWVIRGTATCTLSPDPAPDGTMTAERCTLGGAGNDIYVLGSGYTGSAVLAVSTWIKPVTASGVLTYRNTNTGLGAWTIDMSALSKWTRIYTGSGNYTQSEAWTTTGGGGSGAQFLFIDGVSRIVDIWRPWQVEGAIAGPDAEVQGSLVPQAATNANAPHLIADYQNFCIKAVYARDVWPSTTGYIASIGAAASANSVFMAVNIVGQVQCGDYDAQATPAYRIFGYTPTWANRSVHEIKCCWQPGNANVLMHLDGSAVTTSKIGSGQGLSGLTVPAIGIGSVGVLGQANGSMFEIVTCNTSNPALCR